MLRVDYTSNIRHCACAGVRGCYCLLAPCHYPLSLVFGLGWGFGQDPVIKKLDLGCRTISAPLTRVRALPPPSLHPGTPNLPKPIEKSSFFASFFRYLFGSIYGLFGFPTWFPKFSQDGKKKTNDAFWDRFVLGFRYF